MDTGRTQWFYNEVRTVFGYLLLTCIIHQTTQYSATSVLKIIKNAAEKAGIKKNISPHLFRHSFATHHLENGTDLRYIQTLLGHSSSKTTEVYTQVATNHLKTIKSPIELLNLDEKIQVGYTP